jgi:DNA-directed RNA polymerase subunit F
METLKSGEAPALLTNIEVMELLQKRLTSKSTSLSSLEQGERTINLLHRHLKKKQQTHHHPLRHCEFIEREVYKYLERSPCAKLNIEDMPTLVSKLKQKKQKNTMDVNPNDQDDDHHHHKETYTKNDFFLQQEKMTKYGLTDAEIMQILNLMPTELVEAHLIVEELHTRLSEEEQEELLQLIREYMGV